MSRIKMIALTLVLATLGVVGILARRSYADFESCRLSCDIQDTECHQNCTTTACHDTCGTHYTTCVGDCCSRCKNDCFNQFQSCSGGCTTTACFQACDSRRASCTSACGC
jgi:hypothetical protein